MIIAHDGHVMGMGPAPELAVDILGILASITKEADDETSEEVIAEMIKCEKECGTTTLQDFAQILIKNNTGHISIADYNKHQ